MKRITLFYLIIFAGTAFAQTPDMYVGEVKVKVEPNTLLYVTDDLEVEVSNGIIDEVTPDPATYADAATEIGNFFMDVEGWVNVGTFVNDTFGDDDDSSDDGGTDAYRNTGFNASGSFRLLNNGSDVTSLADNRLGGQLLVRNSAGNSGNAELFRDTFSGQSWVQLAVPFTGLTINDLAKQFNATEANVFTGIGNARYRNTFLYWDNGVSGSPGPSGSPFPAYSAYATAASTFNSSDYVIINANSLQNSLSSTTGQMLSMEGTPFGGDVTYTFVTGNGAGQIFGFDFNAGTTNRFNEQLHTAVSDLISGDCTQGGDVNCGRYQYQFGNPYTTNIDMSFVGVDGAPAGTVTVHEDNIYLQNLLAVGFTRSGAYSSTNGTASTAVDVVNYAAGSGGVSQFPTTDRIPATGDVNGLVVPPMTPLIMKFTDSEAPTTSVNLFTTEMQTFVNTSRWIDGGGTLSRPEVAATSTNMSSIYQVGVNLFDSEEEELARFYVAAREGAINAEYTELEAAIQNGNTMYSIQEELDGSISTTPEAMYINMVGTDFEEAIPVFFESPSAGDYTVKTYLRSDTGSSNLILDENENPVLGVDFYFHDKQTDDYIKMDGQFEYSFNVATEGTIENRFEIFYGEPDNLSTGNVTNELNTTRVYKSDEEGNYGIRFSQKELGKTANVSVYTAVGQMLFNAKEVPTNNAYIIPLVKDSSNFYVVRIEGENGTVVTKKIIKK